MFLRTEQAALFARLSSASPEENVPPPSVPPPVAQTRSLRRENRELDSGAMMTLVAMCSKGDDGSSRCGLVGDAFPDETAVCV